MKMKSRFNRLAFCWILLLCGVWGLSGCGIKAAPVPLRSIPPAAVVDLTVSLGIDPGTDQGQNQEQGQGEAILSWTIPTGKAAGTAGVAGFIVYRAIESAEAACPGCPLLFRRMAQINLEQYRIGAPGEKTVTFRQSINQGGRYIYKVVVLSKDGQRGPDSNRVIVK